MIPTIPDTVCIATTAAEGGIGYWSVITSEYNPSRFYVGPFPVTDLPEDFVFYTIKEDDEAADGEEPQTWDITPKLIRRGFELAMASDQIAGWAFRDQIDESDPESVSYMDAAAADIVIQMGCYGDVIWG